VLFRKIRDVLLVLLNVPFALAGGIMAMLIMGTNFNISAVLTLLLCSGSAFKTE